MKVTQNGEPTPNKEESNTKGVSIDDPRLIFRSEERLSIPKTGTFRVLVDHYWIYLEGRGFLFFRHTPKSRVIFPQCNHNRLIAESIRDRMYPWGEVRLVPVAFVEYDHD